MKIEKIWGICDRQIDIPTCQVDILTLKKDTFCSWHTHQKKINNFIVVRGKIKVEIDGTSYELVEGDSFNVYPYEEHRFVVSEDSVVIEIAYLDKDKEYNISEDIQRKSQGGKLINGIEKTEDELKNV